MVANHWLENFPGQAAKLQKAGQLESAAQRAADRAGLVLAQGAEAGVNWDQAHELATQEWGTPPELN